MHLPIQIFRKNPTWLLLLAGFLFWGMPAVFAQEGGEYWFERADKAEAAYQTDSALRFFRNALEAFESVPNRDKAVECYIRIGTIYSYTQEHKQALLYCDEGLQRNGARKNGARVDLLHLKGLILRQSGEIPEAVGFLEQAALLIPEIRGPADRSLATVYHSLELCLEDTDPDRARFYGRQALEIRKALKDTTELIVSYISLAERAKSKHQTQEAVLWLREAMKRCTSDPQMRARVHFFLGELYAAGKQYHLALAHADSALSVWTTMADGAIPSDPPDLRWSRLVSPAECLATLILRAEARYGLASIQGGEKEMRHALIAFQQTADLIDTLRLRFEGDASKLLLTSNVWRVYEGGITAANALFDMKGSPVWAEAGFAFAERSKAILLLQTLSGNRAAKLLPDSLRQREEGLKKNIARIEASLVNPGSSLKAGLQDSLFRLRTSYSSLEEKIRLEYPAYYRARYDVRIASIQEVRGRLASGQALVEWFQGDNSLFAFGIGKDGIRFLQLGSAKGIGEKVREIVERLREGIPDPENDRSLALGLKGLYESILDPVIPGEAARLILVPDGVLNYLPFEALLSELAPGTIEDNRVLENFWKRAVYVFRDFATTYAYSASVWVNARNEEIRFRSPLSFAPLYSGLDSLPNNLPEAGMVRTLMGGKLCAGPDAGIENFRTLAGNRSILHLAMHGVADDQQPWRSNLWFGGDEALYAFEIQHMKLNSDLAVLSACRTGTGKLQRGEGIMSLAGAFLYAGCRSVVMSLWESDDRYAGVFLEGFYEGLKNGKDKDLALRDARISFLSEAAPSAAHPRNWAGFLLIGDPGPLRSSQPATGRTGWLVLFGVLCLFGGTVFVVRSRKHNSRDREA